jgi:hypothetical protein
MLTLPALPALLISFKTKRTMRTPTSTIRACRRNPIMHLSAVLAAPAYRHTPPSSISGFPSHRSEGAALSRKRRPRQARHAHRSPQESTNNSRSPQRPTILPSNSRRIHGSTAPRRYPRGTGIREPHRLQRAWSPCPICGSSFSRIRDACFVPMQVGGITRTVLVE